MRPFCMQFLLLIAAIIVQCAHARFEDICSGKRSETCSCGQDDLTEDYWVYCGKSSSLNGLEILLKQLKISGAVSLKHIWTNGLQIQDGDKITSDIFQGLKFPDLELLDCGDKSLEVDKDAFEKTKDVLSIIFFKNCKLTGGTIPEAIGTLPQLKFLIMENVGLTMLDGDIFDNNALEQLYLTNNPIEKVSKSTLEPLKNLKVLYLNQIENFKSGILKSVAKGLPNLKILNLDDSKIKDLSGISLKGLENLTTLSINHAKLSTIGQDLLEGLAKLKSLSISRNRINSIDPNVFQGLQNLESLDLSSNFLTKVLPPSFKGLLNLKTLNLARNKFPILQNFAFSSLKNLESLDLSQNKDLTRLGSKAFGNLDNLQKLILRKSKIQSLNSALQNLANLNYLDVSGTDIAVMPDDAFKGTGFIRTLLMNSTYIESLGRNFIESLETLDYFDISDNHFFCDITMVDIVTKLLSLESNRNLFLGGRDETYCDYPKPLFAKNIFEIQQLRDLVLPDLEEQGTFDVISLLFSFIDGDVSACTPEQQQEYQRCDAELGESAAKATPPAGKVDNDVLVGIAGECVLLSGYVACIQSTADLSICKPATYRVKKVVQDLLCSPDFGKIQGKDLACIVREADRFGVNPCVTRLINRVKDSYQTIIQSKGVAGLSCEIIQQAQRCIRPLANNCSDSLMREVETLADAFMTALVGGQHFCEIRSPSTELTEEILEGDLSVIKDFDAQDFDWDNIDALSDESSLVFETVETTDGNKGINMAWKCGKTECKMCQINGNDCKPEWTFKSKSKCEKECAKPINIDLGDVVWQCGESQCESCFRGNCKTDVSTFKNQSVCEIECAKPRKTLYACNENGKCQVCIDPFCISRPYTKKEDCQKSCHKSGNPFKFDDPNPPADDECLPEDQFPDFCNKVLTEFSSTEFCQFRNSSTACSKTCCEAAKKLR